MTVSSIQIIRGISISLFVLLGALSTGTYAVMLGKNPIVNTQSNTKKVLPSQNTKSKAAAASDRLIVKFKSNQTPTNIRALHNKTNARVLFSSKVSQGLQVVEVPPGENLDRLRDVYAKDPSVEYVELDYRVQLKATFPNDTQFSQLWGLNNSGQTSGVVDADINAPEAWDITQGDSSVVVAVVDTGVDYTHIDLVDNIWTNPGEIAGNGIDDDGNGHVDDIHGFDSGDNDSDPMDDLHYHGTHVAGTIGAKGNNANGVSGVNWNVKIIACKIFSISQNTFDAFVSDAVECLDYLYDLKVNHNVNIVATNNSWGWIGAPSQALYEAIERQMQAGILFVAAAGNDTSNTDVVRDFPSTYYLPNIISVAATDSSDNLAFFSNYGARTVHVSAPGVDILSTIPVFGDPGINPPAQNPHREIFFDDVESGVGSWSAQIPWAVSVNDSFSFTSAWTDSPSGNYTDDSNTSLTSPAINLSAYTTQDVYLGFYANYDIETGFDNAYVEVSGNGGASWQSLGGITGSSASWRFFSYVVPVSVKTQDFRFRVRLVTDFIVTAGGITIDDIGVGTTPLPDTGPGVSNNYTVLSGTSMAAPHVVGLLGLTKARYPENDWSQLKNLIISSGTPIAALNESVSGRRIRAADQNGRGALTCVNQSVRSRLQPLTDTVAITAGETFGISVLNVNCAVPGGSLSVTVQESGAQISLADDGLQYDQFAGDGIYSAQVNLTQLGLDRATLIFPDGSNVVASRTVNYLPAKSVAYNWRDISGVSFSLGSGDDFVAQVIPPFPVNFGNSGDSYERVNVSSNGYIVLQKLSDQSFPLSSFFNEPLPLFQTQNIIAPFWDDLVVQNVGELSLGILGQAPNRELVVTWDNVAHIGSTSTINFQVVFFENSSDILFNYRDVVFGNFFGDYGQSATVGVQLAPTVARQYSFETPTLTDQSALLWTINETPISNSPGGGGAGNGNSGNGNSSEDDSGSMGMIGLGFIFFTLLYSKLESRRRSYSARRRQY